MRIIKWIFRCPKDRNLIIIWREKTHHALAQTATTTTVRVGRYKIMSWCSYFTSINRIDEGGA